MATSSRDDQVLVDGTVAVTGSDYETDWFETDDIRTVVVRVEGPQQGWSVQESPNAAQQFSNSAPAIGSGEFLLSARYVRLSVDVNGSGTLMFSVRVGSRV